MSPEFLLHPQLTMLDKTRCAAILRFTQNAAKPAGALGGIMKMVPWHTNSDQFSRRSPLRQALGRFSRIGYLCIRLLRLQDRRGGAITEAVDDFCGP